MQETTKIIRKINALRSIISTWRQEKKTIALVPTMGALHEGHLSLIKIAKQKADKVIVSIFVNPKQFSQNEDLTRYPRDEKGDRYKLSSIMTDLIWAPSISEIYPDNFSTFVIPQGCALSLEGEFRPDHFTGVATVCTKLFSQTMPDYAIFGEKDYQQLCVIRQLVRDLNLPLSIVSGKISREKDGLARSSRNLYLTTKERGIAPALYSALKTIAKNAKYEANLDKAINLAKKELLDAGFRKIDYLAVRDAHTLGPYIPSSKTDGRILAAAWLGKTRLIDNISL
ncbi:MAG: pantoate--beta-alanine ligase [Hyphomicrobium sp.]